MDDDIVHLAKWSHKPEFDPFGFFISLLPPLILIII
jgi:hypothetical protein